MSSPISPLQRLATSPPPPHPLLLLLTLFSSPPHPLLCPPRLRSPRASSLVASGGRDGLLRLWDLRSPSAVIAQTTQVGLPSFPPELSSQASSHAFCFAPCSLLLVLLSPHPLPHTCTSLAPHLTPPPHTCLLLPGQRRMVDGSAHRRLPRRRHQRARTLPLRRPPVRGH